MRLAISCSETLVGRGRLRMSALWCLLRCEGLNLGLLLSNNLNLLGGMNAWNWILVVLMLKLALLLLVGQVLLIVHLRPLLLLLLRLDLLLQNNLLLLLWLWQDCGLLGLLSFNGNYWLLTCDSLHLRRLHILDWVLLGCSLGCLLLGFFLPGCIVGAHRSSRSWVRSGNCDCWLLSTSASRMSFNWNRDLGSLLWWDIAHLDIACRYESYSRSFLLEELLFMAIKVLRCQLEAILSITSATVLNLFELHFSVNSRLRRLGFAWDKLFERLRES